MAASEDNWRSPSFRQNVVAKIDEAVSRSGMPTTKNSMEMENHVFQKAKTREEYLAFVARLILHVREMSKGKPSNLFDNLSRDWAPSVALGYKMHNEKILETSAKRYARLKGRERKKKEAEEKKEAHAYEQEMHETFSAEIEDGIGCQTEISGDGLDAERKMIVDDNVALRASVTDLKMKLNFITISEESLKNDDAKVKFYTGLSTFSLLKYVFEFVSEGLEFTLKSSLSPFQEFLVVLMRLRLDLLEQDLAYRFGVCQQTISNILLKWLPIMADRLKSVKH